jgi:hypothetical protein
MPTRKYLAFDLETAKEFPEGADWRKYRPLGISVAAALASDTGKLTYWYGRAPEGRPARPMNRGEVAAIVRALQGMVRDGGYTLVTWNGLSFDFPILAEESGLVPECKKLALNHVDMMFHLFCLKGHYLAMDAAAKGMGLPGKVPGMTGADVPRLWAQGDQERVLVYLGQDVRTTADLAQACDSSRAIFWTSQRGNRQSVDLPSGCLAVRHAVALPEPDTSWMTDPPKREEFIGWARDEIRSAPVLGAAHDRTRGVWGVKLGEGTNQYEQRDPQSESGPLVKAAMRVGETRALPQGFSITYKANRPAHEFSILGPEGDTRMVRVVESPGHPGEGLCSVRYFKPGEDVAGLGTVVPVRASKMPLPVVRQVIQEIREAVPQIHTVQGDRTGVSLGHTLSSASSRAGSRRDLPRGMNDEPESQAHQTSPWVRRLIVRDTLLGGGVSLAVMVTIWSILSFFLPAGWWHLVINIGAVLVTLSIVVIIKRNLVNLAGLPGWTEWIVYSVSCVAVFGVRSIELAILGAIF